MTVEIVGLRDLLSNLSRKEDEIMKAARRGNLAGGKVVMVALKQNVPRSGYSGPNPQVRLEDAIVMSGNRSDDMGENYVAVGFSKAANFRAHIPEFGSIQQAPTGYMTKTAQSTEGDVSKAMADEIRSVLQ